MYSLTALYLPNQKKMKNLQSISKHKGNMLPSPKPDWGLKHKKPRIFPSVIQAITCLSSRLKILNIS